MANIRYFTADQCGTAVHHDGSIYTSAKHFTGLTTGTVAWWSYVERSSGRPNEQPQVRCALLNATEHVTRECSCGGKFHGAGAFMCEAA